MKIGLILNPIAGMGGSVGLKGTDGDAYERASGMGASPRSPGRIRATLSKLKGNINSNLSIFSSSGAMGGDILAELGISYEEVYSPSGRTYSKDTVKA